MQKKVIGIKKVLGASAFNTMKDLSLSFVFIALAANIIAYPFIWTIVKKWLQNFAFRIDVSFLFYFSVTVFSLVIILLSIGINIGQALRVPPVKVLKYE